MNFRADSLMTKILSARLLLVGFIGCTFFLTPPELSAYGDDAYLSQFSDNSYARRELQKFFADPVREIAPSSSKDFPAQLGRAALRFNVSKTKTHLILNFLSVRSGTFKPENPGSILIKRQLSTGAIDQLQLSLRQSPQIYAIISPRGGHSELSVLVAGIANPAYRRISLPVSIEQLSFKSIAEILTQTKGRISWQLLLDVPDNGYFTAIESMISRIRQALPGLPDGEDGAQDEFGNLTTISSFPIGGPMGLNCSGFAKWIADGLYVFLNKNSAINLNKNRSVDDQQVTEPGYLKIDELKDRHLELRGNSLTRAYEISRDPFFGLDWIRSIGVNLHQARTGQKSLSMLDRDVNNIPFLEFVQNKGYEISDIEAAMYLLALKEPGNFYLAAINGEWGSSPRLWQYYHIAVLFPYIDKQGEFRTVVFERNFETSTASLIKRYPLEKAFLVKIKAAQDFLAPAIK